MARTSRKDEQNLPATPLTPLDYTQALRKAGLIETRQKSDTVRLKLNGNNFYIDDDLVAVYNPMTKEPALRCQILKLPVEYQAKWFDADGNLADFVGRPEIAGKMCRSHYDIPTQATKFAEDGTECRECPVNPYKRREELPREADGQKCGWRGDIQLRLLDASGNDMLDTPVTFPMAFSAMKDFKGISREPEQGYNRPRNFMYLLSDLGAARAGGDEDSQLAGAAAAWTALRLGGVIAEIRAPQYKLSDGKTFNVFSLTPIDIIDITEQPALPGEPEPDADNADEALPF